MGFDQLDKNGDGVITREEFTAGFKEAHRGGGENLPSRATTPPPSQGRLLEDRGNIRFDTGRDVGAFDKSSWRPEGSRRGYTGGVDEHRGYRERERERERELDRERDLERDLESQLEKERERLKERVRSRTPPRDRSRYGVGYDPQGSIEDKGMQRLREEDRYLREELERTGLQLIEERHRNAQGQRAHEKLRDVEEDCRRLEDELGRSELEKMRLKHLQEHQDSKLKAYEEDMTELERRYGKLKMDYDRLEAQSSGMESALNVNRERELGLIKDVESAQREVESIEFEKRREVDRVLDEARRMEDRLTEELRLMEGDMSRFVLNTESNPSILLNPKSNPNRRYKGFVNEEERNKARMESQLNQAEDEKKRAIMEVIDTQRVRENEMKMAHERELTRQQTKLQDAGNLISTLELAVQEHQSECEKHALRYDHLRKETDALTKKMAVKEAGMEEQASALQRECHALRSQLAGAEDTFHIAESARKQSAEANHHQQENIRLLHQKGEEQLREIGELNRQQRRLEVEIDQWRRDVEVVRVQLDQSKAETHEQVSLRAEAKNEVENQKLVADQLKLEIASLQGALGEAKVTIGVAADREGKLNELMRELSYTKENASSLVLSEERLKAELQGKDGILDMNDERYRELHLSQERILEENKKLEIQLEQAHARLETMRNAESEAFNIADGNIGTLRHEHSLLQEALMESEAERSRLHLEMGQAPPKLKSSVVSSKMEHGSSPTGRNLFDEASPPRDSEERVYELSMALSEAQAEIAELRGGRTLGVTDLGGSSSHATGGGVTHGGEVSTDLLTEHQDVRDALLTELESLQREMMVLRQENAEMAERFSLQGERYRGEIARLESQSGEVIGEQREASSDDRGAEAPPASPDLRDFRTHRYSTLSRQKAPVEDSGSPGALGRLLARHDSMLRGVLDEVSQEWGPGEEEIHSDEAVRNEVEAQLLRAARLKASPVKGKALHQSLTPAAAPSVLYDGDPQREDTDRMLQLCQHGASARLLKALLLEWRLRRWTGYLLNWNLNATTVKIHSDVSKRAKAHTDVKLRDAGAARLVNLITSWHLRETGLLFSVWATSAGVDKQSARKKELAAKMLVAIGFRLSLYKKCLHLWGMSMRQDLKLMKGLSEAYGDRKAAVAVRGSAIVLKQVAYALGRPVIHMRCSLMLVISTWGCRVALQRMLLAMQEESVLQAQKHKNVANDARKISCLNLVRLILVRRENEARAWGFEVWRVASIEMKILAREDSLRSSYIRSQLEDAKKAFSQILDDDVDTMS